MEINAIGVKKTMGRAVSRPAGHPAGPLLISWIQYIPERLLVRDDIPSTPSGKIQKFKLREMLQHDPS